MRPMTPTEIKEYEALAKDSKQMTLGDFLGGVMDERRKDTHSSKEERNRKNSTGR